MFCPGSLSYVDCMDALLEPWLLVGLNQEEDLVWDHAEGAEGAQNICSFSFSLTVVAWLPPSEGQECCQVALSTQLLCGFWKPHFPLVIWGQEVVRAPHCCQPQGSVQSLLGFHPPCSYLCKQTLTLIRCSSINQFQCAMFLPRPRLIHHSYSSMCVLSCTYGTNAQEKRCTWTHALQKGKQLPACGLCYREAWDTLCPKKPLLLLYHFM